MSYGRLPLMIIISGRVGIALAGIIAVRVSTSLLTPDQQGTLSQLNSISNLFCLLLVIPVMHFMNRGFLEWFDSGKLVQNTRKYFLFLLAVSSFAFVLSSFLQWKIGIVNGMGIWAVAGLISLFILFQNIYTYGITGFNLFGVRSKFVFFSNLVAWSSIVFSVILFNWFKSPFSWSLGQVIGFLVGCISVVMIWKNLHNQKPLLDHHTSSSIHFNLPSILLFSWPILISSGLGWVQLYSYRFILDKIQGISIVGLFSVGYSLAATAITIYQSIITQYLDPIFFNDLRNKEPEGKIKAWNNYAGFYLPGLVLTCAFIASAAPFLANVLLGKAFREVAIKITIWAAIIETMRASGWLLFQLGLAKIDNRITILPTIAGAILAPLGVYYLGSIDPIYGTIAGLIIAATVVFLISIWLSYRALPISWPFRKILQTLALSLPFMIGLPLIYFFFPKPGFVFSIVVLMISGLYALVIQVFLLKKKPSIGEEVNEGVS